MFQLPLSTDEGYHNEARSIRTGLVLMPLERKDVFSIIVRPPSSWNFVSFARSWLSSRMEALPRRRARLGLAQSTVSEAIASLERELGTTLITHQRGSQTVALTPAGRILLPRGRDVLAAVDKTYAAMANAAVSARGVVNIVANESVSTYLLSPVLAMMRRRWRNTQFAVSVAACPEVREGVRSGAFDLGFLLTSAKQKLGTHAIAANPRKAQGMQLVAPVVPLIIFAAPRHPLLQAARRPAVDRVP